MAGGGGMDFVSQTIAKVSQSFKLSLALISIDLLIICIPGSLVLSIGCRVDFTKKMSALADLKTSNWIEFL